MASLNYKPSNAQQFPKNGFGSDSFECVYISIADRRLIDRQNEN